MSLIVRCPTCKQPAEPQMDCSTHTLYWCGTCWLKQRKPFIFELAHPDASAARSEVAS